MDRLRHPVLALLVGAPHELHALRRMGKDGKFQALGTGAFEKEKEQRSC
jgi:hypothetical protein